MSDARSTAVIDLDALRHNAARLARAAAGAELMAVVKANGYGHGAVACARAALDGGAGSLAVASVEEAEELRLGGITARILIMSPLADGGFTRALAAGCEVVAGDAHAVDGLSGAVAGATSPGALATPPGARGGGHRHGPPGHRRR